MRESRKWQIGDKSPAWKGGITSLSDQIRTSGKYSNWRTQVFGRDNFTCRECSIRGTWLEVHHIKMVSDIMKEYNITTFKSAMDCFELWDLNNGIAYCKPCHELLKKKGGLL